MDIPHLGDGNRLSIPRLSAVTARASCFRWARGVTRCVRMGTWGLPRLLESGWDKTLLHRQPNLLCVDQGVQKQKHSSGLGWSNLRHFGFAARSHLCELPRRCQSKTQGGQKAAQTRQSFGIDSCTPKYCSTHHAPMFRER